MDGIARAEIRFAPVAKCRVCGAEALAPTDGFRLDRIPLSELVPTIQRELERSAAGAPVGWEQSGRGNLRCPKCF